MTVYTTNGAGKPRFSPSEDEIGFIYFILHKKISSKQIKDLNLKPETFRRIHKGYPLRYWDR